MEFSKGQGTMEYLMTYGWALLVIVAIGAALFALGVLNPSTYTQSRCTGLQYFTYHDQRVNTTHYTLDLVNGPKDIDVIDFEVGGVTAENIETTPPSTTSAGNGFLLEGDSTSGKNSGDSFSYAITITYDVVGGIPENVDRGTCTGRIA